MPIRVIVIVICMEKVVLKRVKMKDAVAIQGLPGVGNVGRLVVGYLIRELKAKQIGEIFSHEFVPAVILDEKAEVKMLKIELHRAKAGKRDVLFITGDSQAVTNTGHYKLSWEIAEVLKKLKVKELVTIGGFVHDMRRDVKVLGAYTDKSMKKKFEGYGALFEGNRIVSSIVGEAGLVLAAAKHLGIPGVCLMARVERFPHLMSDPRAAKEVLKILEKYLRITINMKEIDKSIEDLQRMIDRTAEIHEVQDTPEGYIG